MQVTFWTDDNFSECRNEGIMLLSIFEKYKICLNRNKSILIVN